MGIHIKIKLGLFKIEAWIFKLKNNIPNFFTLLNLTIGFYCIVNILNGESISSILLLFYFCFVLDFLDGIQNQLFKMDAKLDQIQDTLNDMQHDLKLLVGRTFDEAVQYHI